MQKVFLHIDLNSYFASAEQQDNPSWRGKPVGVCEHLGGIIIAASIEAKRWGITTGTPVWEARKLYPKIILTKTHPDRYRLYSDRLMKILHDYTAHVEQYSIDEAFLDVTQVCNIKSQVRAVSGNNNGEQGYTRPEFEKLNPKMANPFLEAAAIAQIVKQRMKTEVGDWLQCSVGIGENKLIAKIASDMQKPNGLVIVQPDLTTALSAHVLDSESDRLSPKAEELGQVEVLRLPQSDAVPGNDKASGLAQSLPSIYTKNDLYRMLRLTDIPGIGKRQEKRLNELGIRTLIDLRDYPRQKLVACFGIMGHHLHAMGQFESTWKPQAEQDHDIKSIGHMYTLPKEFREKKYFVPVLYKLSEMVSRRMRMQQLTGNVLHFHIHDKEHQCYGKSKKLGYSIQDGREIFLESMRIFDAVLGRGVFPLGGFKLIGVTIAGLVEENGQQSLFEKDQNQKQVIQALDRINEKYGDFTICRVPVRVAGGIFRDSIGFGRIKEHVRLASFR